MHSFWSPERCGSGPAAAALRQRAAVEGSPSRGCCCGLLAAVAGWPLRGVCSLVAAVATRPSCVSWQSLVRLAGPTRSAAAAGARSGGAGNGRDRSVGRPGLGTARPVKPGCLFQERGSVLPLGALPLGKVNQAQTGNVAQAQTGKVAQAWAWVTAPLWRHRRISMVSGGISMRRC